MGMTPQSSGGSSPPGGGCGMGGHARRCRERKAPIGRRAQALSIPPTSRAWLRGGVKVAYLGRVLGRQCHVRLVLSIHQGGVKVDFKTQLKRQAMKKAWAIKSQGMSNNALADAIRKSKDPFLRSPEWRAVRAQAVLKYGLICCKCGRENHPRSPINFDHIKPRKYFPELALDLGNLQPLCWKCNKAKGNKHHTDYRIGSRFLKVVVGQD